MIVKGCWSSAASSADVGSSNQHGGFGGKRPRNLDQRAFGDIQAADRRVEGDGFFTSIAACWLSWTVIVRNRLGDLHRSSANGPIGQVRRPPGLVLMRNHAPLIYAP
jgi:hypothetical protein